jgi:23S rRNA pseudouridine1911/1915/1917 synthase
MILPNALSPYIVGEARDFLLVYKPPRMHTASNKGGEEAGLTGGGETLSSWTAALFPGILELPGRKEGEGGLIHRLDYETQGLVLFARTREGLDALLAQQEEGQIFKEYSALASPPARELPGFPPRPPGLSTALEAEAWEPPFLLCIESPFRAWGKGRTAVRPAFSGKGRRELATDRGKAYRTQILEIRRPESRRTLSFRLGLVRGFRHQIRSHLAWLGFPILNDALYGGIQAARGFLALRARGLNFYDPRDGRELRFEIPPLNESKL